VIPVPAVPEIAALEDSPVLLDMRSYKRQPPDDLRKLPEIAGDCSPSIVVPQANVPVSETLNDWLTLNGLQRITAGKLKFYDDNGWSFVVQRVSGIEHRNAAALRPVRISFGAGHITFPLRLMTDAGPFFCRLFLVTKRSLDVTPLEEYGFTVNDDLSRTTLKQLPDSAELLVSRSGSSFSVFKELRHGHIHLFSAAGEFRQPLWRSEVQLAGPDVSLSSVVPNVLAVAAAVIAVILMNGPRRKVHNDR
jgi:hypothetical protein